MKDLLKKILDDCSFDYSDIEVIEDGENTRLNIISDSPADIIGAHGNTLTAIQHLFRVQLWRADISGFAVVDVDSYKKSQEENALNMARTSSAKVMETGEDMTLPDMSPDKRRLVHTMISDEYPELKTESVGEGYTKRVRISRK